MTAEHLEDICVYFEKALGDLATDISRAETTLAVSVNNVIQELEYVHVSLGDSPPDLVVLRRFEYQISHISKYFDSWQRHELCIKIDGYWF